MIRSLLLAPLLLACSVTAQAQTGSNLLKGTFIAQSLGATYVLTVDGEAPSAPTVYFAAAMDEEQPLKVLSVLDVPSIHDHTYRERAMVVQFPDRPTPDTLFSETLERTGYSLENSDLKLFFQQESQSIAEFTAYSIFMFCRQGIYVDHSTNETLILDVFSEPALLYEGPNGAVEVIEVRDANWSRLELSVTLGGNADVYKLQLGRTFPTATEPAKPAILWTNPNGSQQTFY